MSSEALAWAFKQNVKPSGAKFTLIALCECANYKTGRITPSIAHLEEITGQNRKSIIAHIDQLVTQGFILDTGERCGRTMQIKVYEAAIGTVPKTEPSQKRNSTVSGVKQSQKRDTEPSLEPSCSTEPNGSSEHKRVRAKPDAFPCPNGVDPIDWQSLVASRKSQRAPMNAGAYRQIIKKLDAWAGEGWPPGPIVAHAVERGWRTVFETDEMKGSVNGRGRIQRNGSAAAHDSRDGVARALDRRLGLDGPAGAPGRRDAGTGEGYRQLPAPSRDPLF